MHIHELYHLIAKDYARDRNRNPGKALMEADYLDRIVAALRPLKPYLRGAPPGLEMLTMWW